MYMQVSVDSDSSKKRSKFQLKLKKLHKSFRKARPSNPAEVAITGAGSVSSQSEAGMNHNYQRPPPHGEGSSVVIRLVMVVNALSHDSTCESRDTNHFLLYSANETELSVRSGRTLQHQSKKWFLI